MIRNQLDAGKLRKVAIEKLERSGTASDRALIGVIRQAKVDNHWGVGDRVNIGPFTEEKHFWTELFHEAGHVFLGVGSEVYEEEKCHHFSRRITARLNLPYDPELENSSRIVRGVLEGWNKNGKFDAESLEAIPEEHRAILWVSNRNDS